MNLQHIVQLMFLAAVAVLLSGSQCGTPKPDPVLPTDTDSCVPGCEHLRELGCKQGEPLADGTPCEIFCAETQGNGFPIKPSCWVTLEKVTAPECPEIDQVCFGHEE